MRNFNIVSIEVVFIFQNSQIFQNSHKKYEYGDGKICTIVGNSNTFRYFVSLFSTYAIVLIKFITTFTY